jgi:hypothetical protein
MLAAGVLWGPAAWGAARVAYWTRQCNRYVAPADRPVYEEDPTRGAALLRAGGTTAARRYLSDPPTRYVARPPDCLAAFLAARRLTPASADPVVFLHERTAPGGERRLVYVAFYGRPGPSVWRFEWGLYSGDGYTLSGWSLDVNESPTGSLRFFAGQPDPADASHFTIGYEMGGKPGTVDGWLDHGGSLRLKVRDGPAAWQ